LVDGLRHEVVEAQHELVGRSLVGDERDPADRVARVIDLEAPQPANLLLYGRLA
jgi:hypothetical protein